MSENDFARRAKYMRQKPPAFAAQPKQQPTFSSRCLGSTYTFFSYLPLLRSFHSSSCAMTCARRRVGGGGQEAGGQQKRLVALVPTQLAPTPHPVKLNQAMAGRAATATSLLPTHPQLTL